ncbi:hypothetical protein BH10PSE4_BH10PSE4_01890 [soil metagenome]
MPRLFQEYPKTARKLMLAAERLYGQHGLDGVSLRQLATAAGQANNYVVQHHFGSKLGLIQAVSEMRLPAMEAHRQTLLDAARAEDDYSVPRMLSCLFSPLVTVLEVQDMKDYARFTLAVMHLDPEQHPFVRSADISPASTVIHGKLSENLSHLAPDVFRRRLALSASVFLNGISELGGKLKLSPTGYASNDQYCSDIFEAALAVLTCPFSTQARADFRKPEEV